MLLCSHSCSCWIVHLCGLLPDYNHIQRVKINTCPIPLIAAKIALETTVRTGAGSSLSPPCLLGPGGAGEPRVCEDGAFEEQR